VTEREHLRTAARSARFGPVHQSVLRPEETSQSGHHAPLGWLRARTGWSSPGNLPGASADSSAHPRTPCRALPNERTGVQVSRDKGAECSHPAARFISAAPWRH
jgi:hypothetical protein